MSNTPTPTIPTPMKEAIETIEPLVKRVEDWDGWSNKDYTTPWDEAYPALKDCIGRLRDSGKARSDGKEVIHNLLCQTIVRLWRLGLERHAWEALGLLMEITCSRVAGLVQVVRYPWTNRRTPHPYDTSVFYTMVAEIALVAEQHDKALEGAELLLRDRRSGEFALKAYPIAVTSLWHLGRKQAAARVLKEGTRRLISLNRLREAGELEDLWRTLRSRTSKTAEGRKNSAVEAPKSHQDARSLSPNIFRRMGDYWQVGYRGTNVAISHTSGMPLIAYLLAHPGEKHHVEHLLAITKKREARLPQMSTRGLQRGGLREVRSLERPDKVVDLTALTACEARMRELRPEIEEADAAGDIGRKNKLWEELESIRVYVKAATTPKGKIRVVSHLDKKLRARVSAAIRRSMGRISKHHKELGSHLSLFLHPGRRCSYRPDTPTFWDVEF